MPQAGSRTCSHLPTLQALHFESTHERQEAALLLKHAEEQMCDPSTLHMASQQSRYLHTETIRTAQSHT